MARRRGQLLDGVLLLDKPEGLSSNHALQRARRTLDARKAGHTGTLDPFATGLLICCFGKATKICGAMLEADKCYEATLAFGEETDSGDLTGNIVAEAPEAFSGVDRDALLEVLPAFRGEIEQVPPMYSALKRDGKPLYEYARQGIEAEGDTTCAKAIYRIKIWQISRNAGITRVRAAKGTYIRTLAQDIGRRLGCGAHLHALRRTRIGDFDIADAVGLESFQAMEQPQQALLPLNALPPGLLPTSLLKKD